MRKETEWAAGLALLLLLAGCARPLTHAQELFTATPHPLGKSAPPLPVLRQVSAVFGPASPVPRPASPVPRPASPVPTSAVHPTTVPQPAAIPMPDVLPTVVSRPAPVPTPFPDEPEIVDIVLETGTSEHWASYVVGGSFTACDADERLALVGNIGDHNEVRWVVVEQTDAGGWLRGTSECLGSGLDAPPSFDLPPDVIDFDEDGRQELLSHCSTAHGGWKASTDALYRWDGHAMTSIWKALTEMSDTAAGDQDVLSTYGVDYRAEWEWEDLDDRGLDEIVVRDHVTFYEPGEGETGRRGTASAGEEDGERAFRWDGEAFRPYAPDGPDATFAYVASGDVWLWQNHAARPLGAEHVQEMRWSPDGERVVWWSQPPRERASEGISEGASEGAILGTYNLSTGVRRQFSLEGGTPALHWAPDGRLAYALPGRSPVLLDLESGQQEPLPVATLDALSPDGKRVAYEQDGNLYVYDLVRGQERTLVVALGEGEAAALMVLPDVAWSPQGDWIACQLSSHSFTWVGLVSPDLAQPVSALDLLGMIGGRGATGLQLTWSPDNSRLAALTTAPTAAQQPENSDKTSSLLKPLGQVAEPSGRAVLYLAEVIHREGDPVGQPAWKETLELETGAQDATLAWSPDGERVTIAAGNELWEMSAAGETTLRHRFSFPQPRWQTLEWAPDGSGILAGLESARHGRLYWIPAGRAKPVLLLAGDLGAAQWAPRTEEPQASPEEDPAMVLVEYGHAQPRLHFLRENGSDLVVRASGATRCTSFQVGDQRAYYDGHYTDRRRVRTLRAPDAPGGCQPPMVRPDGQRLAWLCTDGSPDWQALVDGTAEIHFRLIVTDWRGRGSREVWHHVETDPGYRSVHLMGWGAGGATVYLSRPKYGAAWAYFPYNPGILALDVSTGQATQIGDLDGVHDGLVSPDGTWLVQSWIPGQPDDGESIVLRSLDGGMERTVACAQGTAVAGDFSFSPENTWLAWREWASGPGGPRFAIRALRLPDGEPFTVHEDDADISPRIGGWLHRDDLVLVYPLRQDGTGEYSTVLTLPATGPGYPLSPFAFLGVLGGN